jgi:DNA-binding Lrp family transcriptional regulator
MIAMKDVKLKLLSELIKNSKRSDRDLAKIIGVSQPTITRTRARLEKEGYIKEYTMIPDFSRLGFELLALTFVHYSKAITSEEYDKVKKAASEVEKQYPHSTLMAMSGTGFGYERVFVTFHESYSSFAKMIGMVRQLPCKSVADIQSFLIPLTGEKHYQPLTFLAIANYLLNIKKKSLE